MNIEEVASALRPLEGRFRAVATELDDHRRASGEIKLLHDGAIARIIEEVLGTQADFQGAPRAFMSGGSSQTIAPGSVAYDLYLDAGRQGVDAAVRRLQKVLNAELIDARWTARLEGASVAGRLDLAGGLYLVPFDDLPRSRAWDSVNRAVQPGYGLQAGLLMPGAAAIVCEMPASPWIVPTEEIDDLGLKGMQRVEDTALLLTALPGCAPFLKPCWYSAEDPDFEPYMSSGFRWSFDPGGITIPQPIGYAAKELVQAFEASNEATREVVRFLLRRLRSAKHQFNPIDQALDACICLEAMLSCDRERDHTRAVRERTLLMVNQLESGRAPGRAVRALLKLRGKVAHGRIARDRPAYPIAEIVKDAIDMCEQVVGRVVRASGTPCWRPIADELMPAETHEQFRL